MTTISLLGGLGHVGPCVTRRSLFSLLGLPFVLGPETAHEGRPLPSAIWFPPGYDNLKMVEMLNALKPGLPKEYGLMGRLAEDGSWIYRVVKRGRPATHGWLT